MAGDPPETYVQILTADLQRALDFLKFAEAKNAALLALASAWIGADVGLECSDKVLAHGFAIAIPITLLCAVCAALLAMVALLPRLQLSRFLGARRAGSHRPNLLYYGDISALPIRTVEKDLSARYLPTGHAYREEYIHDLVVQLSVNSAITMRKMRLFNWGMRCILIGGLALLVASMHVLFLMVKAL